MRSAGTEEGYKRTGAREKPVERRSSAIGNESLGFKKEDG